MRVHELAKELELTSKVLLSKVHELGIEVKNHMSALSEEQIEVIRELHNSSEETSTSALGHQAVHYQGEKQPALSDDNTAQTEAAPQEKQDDLPNPEVAAREPEDVALEPSPGPPDPPSSKDKILKVSGPIIVKAFAVLLGLRPNQLVAELMANNVLASINERIDLKLAKQIAAKHGFELEHEKRSVEHKAPIRPEEKDDEPEEDQPEDLIPRPPVVAFLGHVDHGKTSLLDYIRKAKVASGEAGGITQHIGAYTIETNEQSITFLDTPGHEAFTAMRARGANLTDIVVLIIAGDDGIMPQTREAIKHAKAADVSIMVAINKCDLPKSNPEQVKQQLQAESLTPEEWGGDLVCVPVSAKTGDGVDQLLEMISLQAEILELKANPKRRAQGYVIEARLEPGMGPTTNLLVRKGTLRIGDAMVCGHCCGKVKALINDQGVKVKSAGPSAAVKCLGLTEVPEAGSAFKVANNERAARSAATASAEQRKHMTLAAPKRASLEDLLRQEPTVDKKVLSVVLKADVQGSVEAIVESLKALEGEKASVNIILDGVGNITGNDVLLASASNAIIIGFQVGKENGVSSASKREGVEIRLYSIIYELLDEVKTAMVGMLDPEKKERVLGHAKILQVFALSKKAKAAGCMVTDGKLNSKAKARVMREGDVVFEGYLSSLKRFQNDAQEVVEGQECGIRLERFSDYKEQDVIELYEVEMVKQEL